MRAVVQHRRSPFARPPHRISPDDRQITGRLYGGDHDMRIRQEMVLGIGGIRALRALGKKPAVCRMNEDYSAFCGLGRIRAAHGHDPANPLQRTERPLVRARPARQPLVSAVASKAAARSRTASGQPLQQPCSPVAGSQVDKAPLGVHREVQLVLNEGT